jgi:uncharacterized LabA/DUF88 family protein
MANYAFIDGQNLYKSVQELGWTLDYKKFRIYLKDKFKVEKAFLFIGRIDKNEGLYAMLSDFGYLVIFKEVLKRKDGTLKGNVDSELVLETMIQYNNYEKAIIVAGDGDYGCLVKYLNQNNKLRIVVVPTIEKSSILLRRACTSKIISLETIKDKVEYIRKEVESCKDGTVQISTSS